MSTIPFKKLKQILTSSQLRTSSELMPLECRDIYSGHKYIHKCIHKPQSAHY